MLIGVLPLVVHQEANERLLPGLQLEVELLWLSPLLEKMLRNKIFNYNERTQKGITYTNVLMEHCLR